MKTTITLSIPGEFDFVCNTWRFKDKEILQEYIRQITLPSVMTMKMGRKTTHRILLRVSRTLAASAALAFLESRGHPNHFLDCPRRSLHEEYIMRMLKLHLSNAGQNTKDSQHGKLINSWHKLITPNKTHYD